MLLQRFAIFSFSHSVFGSRSVVHGFTSFDVRQTIIMSHKLNDMSKWNIYISSIIIACCDVTQLRCACDPTEWICVCVNLSIDRAKYICFLKKSPLFALSLSSRLHTNRIEINSHVHWEIFHLAQHSNKHFVFFLRTHSLIVPLIVCLILALKFNVKWMFHIRYVIKSELYAYTTREKNHWIFFRRFSLSLSFSFSSSWVSFDAYKI